MVAVLCTTKMMRRDTVLRHTVTTLSQSPFGEPQGSGLVETKTRPQARARLSLSSTSGNKFAHFIRATNIVLLHLNFVDVPGLPSSKNKLRSKRDLRNDSKPSCQYHQGAGSKRKPDVIVSCLGLHAKHLTRTSNGQMFDRQWSSNAVVVNVSCVIEIVVTNEVKRWRFYIMERQPV
jgi:hypothetical protein